jgi:hypothetical protein
VDAGVHHFIEQFVDHWMCVVSRLESGRAMLEDLLRAESLRVFVGESGSLKRGGETGEIGFTWQGNSCANAKIS